MAGSIFLGFREISIEKESSESISEQAVSCNSKRGLWRWTDAGPS